MKTKKTLPAILTLAIIFPLATLFCACSHDTSHSGTDGGSIEMHRNSANNSYTTSTPNVITDTVKDR
jgi:hypothetical protein